MYVDGICIGLNFVTRDVGLEKMAVASCVGYFILNRGGYGGEDLKLAWLNELIIVKLSFLLDEAFLGVPPVQVVSQQNVLPPNWLENVAASLCPVNL